MLIRSCFVAVGLALAAVSIAAALDRVVIKQAGVEQALVGRIVVTAEDGGLMVETREGTLWTVPPEELVSKQSDAEPFRPLTADETALALKSELPPGFEVYQTKHYVICYNTSRAYAQWCGSLFERLYQGFQNYWTNRGFTLKEPEYPLTAIVFADRASYARYARTELGDGVDAIIGYYSLKTNRMTLFDMTGTAGSSASRGTQSQIAQTLAQPDAAKTVATIVHEATHQIAFNCGLHRRYADIPLWVSEGLAVYFETPDVGNSKGWSTIGAVNHARLHTLRVYAPRRPADSIETLIRDDERMRNPQMAADAYAEAWALNYFLINAKSQQYRAYIKELAVKEPLVWDKPEERLAAFRRAFGDDLQALDRDFQRYISRLR